MLGRVRQIVLVCTCLASAEVYPNSTGTQNHKTTKPQRSDGVRERDSSNDIHVTPTLTIHTFTLSLSHTDAHTKCSQCVQSCGSRCKFNPRRVGFAAALHRPRDSSTRQRRAMRCRPDDKALCWVRSSPGGIKQHLVRSLSSRCAA